MILYDLVEDVEDISFKERLIAGKQAQDRVKSALRAQLGKEMKNVKVARVGSKLFDIEADIKNVRQKIEVKSLSNNKPYFAFFDTFVSLDQPSPFLDKLTHRVTNGKYTTFSTAISKEPDGGFPCETGKTIPKSGRIPKILKNVTDQYILDYVRMELLQDLTSKGINYLAIVNRSTSDIGYYHISGDNLLNAPKLPHFRRITFDTYGAPNVCAIRVVVRIAL